MKHQQESKERKKNTNQQQNYQSTLQKDKKVKQMYVFGAVTVFVYDR